jgi:hypothetical protein
MGSENISTFGFENEDIKGGIYDKYKGKKGVTDRGAIVYSDPTAMFAGAKIHFKDRFFLCKKGLCCEKLGAAKWRVGAVLVKYGTDKFGVLKEPFSYELYPWIFSETTFIKLKAVDKEFLLTTHDIKISCTNEEYQHIEIVPCNESIWRVKEALRAKILKEATPIWEYIKRGIASDLSAEEIKDLLTANTGTADPTTHVDLDSVLNKI